MARNYDYDEKSKVPAGSSKSSNKSEEINSLVSQLIKKNANDHEAFARLRSKFNNDDKMIYAVFDAFKERRDLILHKASKFKNLLHGHYRNSDLSFSEFMRKARKYKTKYSLTNEEFDLFYKLALSDNEINKTNYYNIPNTPMSKLLGFSPNFGIMGEKLKLTNKDDHITMDNIRKVFETSRELHKHVILQSLSYEDCAENALTGRFRKGVHNPYSCIHPIIAAMFFSKIAYLEERMLYASIPNIVLQKYNSGVPLNKHDFDLYLDLVSDEGEMGYTNNPLESLSYRSIAQAKIWEAVLNLRLGQYYNHNLAQFIEVLDNCNANFFDAPDMSLVRDEGTMLRRILNIFSLRPILVTIAPIYMTPSNVIEHPQVTSVPMITVRIQPNILPGDELLPINLIDSMTMPQLYIEHKIIVKKSQIVMACRNVLFFHIPRRYHSYNVFMKYPTNVTFNDLPTTISGFETVNDRIVNVPSLITLHNENYEIKSAVVLELSSCNKNLIIGTSSLFVKRGTIDDSYFCYNPQGVLINAPEHLVGDLNIPVGTELSPIIPILSGTDITNPSEISFFRDISIRGTIIMYASHVPSCSTQHIGMGGVGIGVGTVI